MLTNEFNVPPGPIYKELIGGRSIQSPDGRLITSEMVVGKPRRPRKIVILGDTYDPSALIDHAMDADVLVHEATCSDEDLQVALSKGHSTAGMAGDFAKRIRAKHLILNHFSPRGFRPNEYEESKNIRIILQQARDKFESDFVYAARVKNHLNCFIYLLIHL
jgi:ribonuclease Z